MNSNRVFLAAAALIAGLLVVAFATPEASEDIPGPDIVQPVPDGRVGPRYRFDDSADPNRTRNANTSAELNSVYEQEMNRKDAAGAREAEPETPKRSFWDRLLGRKKHVENGRDAETR